MAAALSLHSSILCGNPSGKTAPARPAAASRRAAHKWRRSRWWDPATVSYRTGPARRTPAAGSRADDSSAPSEMTMESALKLLGVSEDASFDDILRAKNAVLASCKDDEEAAAQVETAYDMLLMQRLSERRAGKVASRNIRYADVKPIRTTGTGAMPEWLQKTVKNIPLSVETPSTRNLGIQAGVYGALMVFTFVSGSTTTSAADVPGLILATSFGASLYFLSQKRIGLGKATLVTVGGLVVGAVIGSAVEQWLQSMNRSCSVRRMKKKHAYIASELQLVVADVPGRLRAAVAVIDPHERAIRPQVRWRRAQRPGLNLAQILNQRVGLDDRHRELAIGVPSRVFVPEEPVLPADSVGTPAAAAEEVVHRPPFRPN